MRRGGSSASKRCAASSCHSACDDFPKGRGSRASSLGPALGGGRGNMRPIHYLRCFAGIATREWLPFLNQRGRFFSALVRPLVWLAIFATRVHLMLGVSRLPPYETYMPYEVCTP